MDMDVRDQKILADTIQQLMAAAGSPANLTSSECRKLGDALAKLASAFPDVADRVPRFVSFTGLTLAAYDVKTGTAGTWNQATKKREAEVTRIIKKASMPA